MEPRYGRFLFKTVDANVRGEEQTCFRTKAGKSGRSKSRPVALRLRCLGRSTNLRMVQLQRFGSIFDFQISRHTSPAGTLRPTQPAGFQCRATRNLPWCHIQDEVCSSHNAILWMALLFSLPQRALSLLNTPCRSFLCNQRPLLFLIFDPCYFLHF